MVQEPFTYYLVIFTIWAVIVSELLLSCKTKVQYFHLTVTLAVKTKRKEGKKIQIFQSMQSQKQADVSGLGKRESLSANVVPLSTVIVAADFNAMLNA